MSPASHPRLTPARRRGLRVLFAAHWGRWREVRESSSTSPLVDGEPQPNGWGELCVYWQVLAWLREHGYVQHRPGSDSHYVLTPTGVELAHTVVAQETQR